MVDHGAYEPHDLPCGIDCPDHRLLGPDRGLPAGRAGEQYREERNPEEVDSALHGLNLPPPTGVEATCCSSWWGMHEP